MPRKNQDATTLRVSRRELATILAGLRFHQAENLQGGRLIPDQFIKEIATDGGLLDALGFQEVDKLCQRLNTGDGCLQSAGMVIDPPHQEDGGEPLCRVVYAIDLNAISPLAAAKQAHRIMTNPQSLPPILDIMDHRGKVVRVDLSKH